MLRVNYRHIGSGREIHSTVLASQTGLDSDAVSDASELTGCDTAYLHIVGGGQMTSGESPIYFPACSRKSVPVTDELLGSLIRDECEPHESVEKAIREMLGADFVVLSLTKKRS